MTKIGNIVERRLEELHEKYSGRLRPLAVKLCRGSPDQEPDDLVQEAFARFLAHEESIPKHIEPIGWLIRVMIRYFIDQKSRTQNRQRAVEDPTLLRRTVSQETVLPTYERIAPERFAWAVGRLREKQRVTFLLRSEGLTNPQIALKLGVDVGTVAKRYFDALKSLRKSLGPYVDEGIQ